MTGGHISLWQVAGTLVLVGIAMAASFWRRADLEQDIGIAVIRSFIQLTAVGYVIKAIFDSNSLWLVVALLAFMVLFGAWTARGRAKGVPHVFVPLLLALGTAAADRPAHTAAVAFKVWLHGCFTAPRSRRRARRGASSAASARRA
jgi:putative ABC transport system permease protein